MRALVLRAMRLTAEHAAAAGQRIALRKMQPALRAGQHLLLRWISRARRRGWGNHRTLAAHHPQHGQYDSDENDELEHVVNR
ncbi:hypothetical protein DZC73_19230 [Albitalea terrae]|uniref:Uncharacterized protein n=1 Tax=Piscinibacter terrae TaxID=2496871 RepID=A0A3N7HR29_9BURK|nr:hypothetical protein DZC73_19230 [Albitalea terrae]